MNLTIPFYVAAEQKAARVEVHISLAFLYWVGIALRLWPFYSDKAIFVLKRDVKLQLTVNGKTISQIAYCCVERDINPLLNQSIGVCWWCVYDVQKKAALRNTIATQLTPRSSSDSSTDAAATLPPPRPCPMIPIHTNQPWFHGHISRDRSVSLLAEHGLVDGLVLPCTCRHIHTPDCLVRN